MSGVRVLVGTRKGAFVLTSDGKRERWDIAGPHMAGWEIYHVKGSPVEPNRLYGSDQSLQQDDHYVPQNQSDPVPDATAAHR